MVNSIVCPLCKQADRVEKVSTIYMTGIGIDRLPPTAGSQPERRASNLELKGIPASSLKALSRKLAPPSSRARVPTRPLHPDLVVLVFSLIAPVFLYGILTSQPGVLLPALAILAGFYGLYFLKRKQLIAKFERQQTARNAADERVKRGIERWMKLYYCIRDDGVFERGSGELVPVDQMAGYLLRA